MDSNVGKRNDYRVSFYHIAAYPNFFITSERHLEIRKISPQFLKERIGEERLSTDLISSEQFDYLKKIYQENKESVFDDSVYFSEKKGYALREQGKKLFKLLSKCSWYKSESMFGCETYEVLVSRNSFTKNAEYTLFISHEAEQKKISFTLIKRCCENRLMAVMNKRGWLEVK